MDTPQLLEMLNKDLADEHAAILRYLIHSYLEGEDTPIGAKLLSRARDEMWHMHWLGMIIGAFGGEPDMTPADYPHDPGSRAGLFKSYVAYEENLVPHYKKEAELVDDPHIKRVLLREAWESEMHAEKFKKMIDKLSPEEAAGLPGEENELSESLVKKLQQSVAAKYQQMLQALRDAWVFQEEGLDAWRRMDFSMTKMKQLAHSSEEVAENGITPDFTAGALDLRDSFTAVLDKAVADLQASRDLHAALQEDAEAQKHGGLMSNLDLTIRQEEYEIEEIRGARQKKK